MRKNILTGKNFLYLSQHYTIENEVSKNKKNKN